MEVYRVIAYSHVHLSMTCDVKYQALPFYSVQRRKTWSGQGTSLLHETLEGYLLQQSQNPPSACLGTPSL